MKGNLVRSVVGSTEDGCMTGTSVTVPDPEWVETRLFGRLVVVERVNNKRLRRRLYLPHGRTRTFIEDSGSSHFPLRRLTKEGGVPTS